MRFKTNKNIFNDFGEYFNPNWFDSDKRIIPPTIKWDYSREMRIEDVDLWEVIYEASGGTGVFAAYSPYAEFYMIRPGGGNPENDGINSKTIELFYGVGAENRCARRMEQLGIPYSVNKLWVDEEDIWLHP